MDVAESEVLLLQITLIALILCYGIILSRLIPRKLHFISNLGFAASLVLVFYLLGMSFSQNGLGIYQAASGLLYGCIAALSILITAYLLTSLPFIKHYFLNQHSILRSHPSKIAYETAVRIPFSTALSEEILFRGVLLGVLLQYHTSLIALLLTSIVFGIWHIFPTINSLNEDIYTKARANSKIQSFLHITATVMVTALAGMFFGWLRLLSGSILAPWLAHWATNSSGVLAVLFVGRDIKKTAKEIQK